MLLEQWLKTHIIFKRLAMALYAQADLRLCWSHIPHCWKSNVDAHMCIALESAASLFIKSTEDSYNNVDSVAK